jgi:hypothetical protein
VHSRAESQISQFWPSRLTHPELCWALPLSASRTRHAPASSPEFMSAISSATMARTMLRAEPAPSGQEDRLGPGQRATTMSIETSGSVPSGCAARPPGTYDRQPWFRSLRERTTDRRVCLSCGLIWARGGRCTSRRDAACADGSARGTIRSRQGGLPSCVRVRGNAEESVSYPTFLIV